MPTLNWIGKEKVLTHHLDVPYRPLSLSYTYGAAQSANKIIHGDNLLALKSLLPAYEGKIKCIYIDPPYNTGNEGWVYNDNVKDPKIQKWLGEVVGKESEDLSRHDKWLCMMYPRLKLLHKLLAEDGAIFISIDDNEQAHLKLLMDEIFGEGNFVEKFAWYKTYSPSNLSHKSKKCLEYILCYEKRRNNNRYRGLLKVNKADNPLIKSSNNVKELRFPKDAVTSSMTKDFLFKRGAYGTTVTSVLLKEDVWFRDGQFESDLILESKFIWTQEKLNEEIRNGTKIIFKTKSLAPRYDKASYKPEVPRNLVDKNDFVGTTEEGGVLLKNIFGKNVFSYPKPPSLIKYIVNFLSDPDSIILDSFAGSGTTAQAVLELNKEDGGNRQFILIEMEEYAERITAERVRRVIDGYGAGAKAVAGLGGDFGFYHLGPSIFKESNPNFLNEDLEEEELRKYIFYTETGSLKGYRERGAEAPYFMGTYEDRDYFFFYEKEESCHLTYKFLEQIELSSDEIRGVVIYADLSLIGDEFLASGKIIFKKIPRDIARI
ncbi:site-specific DNA-methyltransferase [Saprospira sp. CCB-QB6]|uniref:site-specific DNA-methyltransferase n=1 Tax=Saprospira sp. CCB-QB6 TaxID=3023936 RepID=UPI00234A8567|nr:site-specific DNA-methyltransferase [Saprospira sp. CCB-QB6]WCL80801.1 site-specific DNA-methyltransferase [Saprospira sp. CCB-QB6]